MSIKSLNSLRYIFSKCRPIPYFVTVVSTLLCIIPMLTCNISYGEYNKSNAPIIESLNSISLKNALASAITVVSCIVFELFFDSLDHIVRRKTFYILKFCRSNGLSFSMAIFLIILYGIIIPFKFIQGIPLIFHSFRLLYIYFFLTLLRVNGKKLWAGKGTTIVGIIFTIAEISKCYFPFASDSNASAIKIMASVLHLLGIIGLIFMSSRWFKNFLLFSKRNRKDKKPLPPNEYLSIIYLVVALVAMTIHLIADSFVQPLLWVNVSGIYLAINVYVASFVTLGISMAHSREKKVTQNLTKDTLDTRVKFASYLNHAIRTPINVAILGIRLLYDDMRQLGDDRTRIETVLNIKDSCNAVTTVLDDLMTYENFENSLLKSEMKLHRVWRFLQETVRPFLTKYSVDGVEVILDNNETDINMFENWSIRADKDTMQHVIRHIISNALKFTPCFGRVVITAKLIHNGKSLQRKRKGSVLGQITKLRSGDEDSSSNSMSNTTTSININTNTNKTHPNFLSMKEDSIVSDAFIRISIIDTGPGLSEERQNHVFKELNYFSSDTKADQASGLGLWLAGGIVDMHGGYISATSPGSGRGCTFTIELPLFPKEDEEEISRRISKSTFRQVWNKSKSDVDRPSVAGLGVGLGLGTVATQGGNRVNPGREMALTNIVEIENDVFLRNRDSIGTTTILPVKSQNYHRSSATTPTWNGGGGGGGSSGTGFPEVRLEYHHEDDPIVEEEMIGKGITNTKNTMELLNVNSNSSAIKPLSVLLVDDSNVDLKMMLRILCERNSVCVCARDGNEALVKVKQSMQSRDPYDIILMDFEMPIMDGPTATEEIRKLGYGGALIGVTGKILSVDSQYFLSKGADRVISKPLTLNALDIVLTELLPWCVWIPSSTTPLSDDSSRLFVKRELSSDVAMETKTSINY